MARIARSLALLGALIAVAAPMAPGGLALLGDQDEITGNTFSTISCFPTWWNESYGYRKQISIATGSAAVTSGYSVGLAIDHASLVTAGKSQADGDDVRIVYWNGSTCDWQELDRFSFTWNSSATKVWWALQRNISSTAADNAYYVYYGYTSASNPPADADNVFLEYDDFEDGTLDPAWEKVREPATWNESGGKLNITTPTETNLEGATNTAPLFLIDISGFGGDIEITTYSPASTWNNGMRAGVVLYEGDDDLAMAVKRRAAVGGTKRAEFFWESSGANGRDYVDEDQTAVWLMLRRYGDTVEGWYAPTSTGIWTMLGSDSIPSLTPTKAGFTAFSSTTLGASVSFTHISIRKIVDPEPTTSASAEQPNP